MAFRTVTKKGVTYLTSDALLSRHAFSTRIGGVSTLPHTADLNLAFGRGDEREVVLENLARFAEAVGVDPAAVVSVPQVHGNGVHVLSACHRGMGYRTEAAFEGDGYVTADPAVVPGIKTADCTPILLEARVRGRPVAVSALHAGWKGSVADIAGAGVRQLTETARAVAGTSAGITVHAAIGPCIHTCCFEVKEDCLTVVRASLGDMAEAYVRRRGAQTFLDLPALNRALLIRAGVAEAHVDVCPDCTACTPSLFYSHRASGGVRGTMLSVISLTDGKN